MEEEMTENARNPDFRLEAHELEQFLALAPFRLRRIAEDFFHHASVWRLPVAWVEFSQTQLHRNQGLAERIKRFDEQLRRFRTLADRRRFVKTQYALLGECIATIRFWTAPTLPVERVPLAQSYGTFIAHYQSWPARMKELSGWFEATFERDRYVLPAAEAYFAIYRSILEVLVKTGDLSAQDLETVIAEVQDMLPLHI